MDYLDVLVGFVNSKSQVDILNCTNFGYSYIFATKKEVAATALSLIRSLIISGKACKNNSLVILAIEKQYLGACMTVLLNFLVLINYESTRTSRRWKFVIHYFSMHVVEVCSCSIDESHSYAMDSVIL